jgi:hypothetical protein
MSPGLLGAAFVGFVLSLAFGRFGQLAAEASKVPLGASYVIGAAGAFLPVLLMGLDVPFIFGYLAALCHLAWRFARESARSKAARLKQQEKTD